MNLKNITLFSIIGICYIFVSRTIATFIPNIFRNLLITQINTLISFLISLVIFAFYIYFYRDYVQEKQNTLKNASILVIIGSFTGMLLFLKDVLFVFNLYVIHSQIFNIIAPWINSIFSLYFFYIFYKTINVRSKLKSATLLASIGFSFSILLRTLIIINYFHLDQFKWLWNYSNEFSAIFLPIFAFMFFTNFYFFLVFYKEQ